MFRIRRILALMLLGLLPAVAPSAAALQTTTDGLFVSDLTLDRRVELARRMLRSPDPRVRQGVFQALTQVENPDAQLAAALAVETAGELDAAAVDVLIATLVPTNRRAVLEPVARALAINRANPRAQPRLTELARRGGSVDLRVAATRALGLLTDKAAAQTLVEILTTPDEPSPAVRNAASDALLYMTDLRVNGRDAERWNAWWRGMAGIEPSEFSERITRGRILRADQNAQRVDNLVDEYRRLLQQQYNVDVENRQALIERALQSREPGVRSAAVSVVESAFLVGTPVPRETRDLLLRHIADSDWQVRVRTAILFRQLNDPTALGELLGQLTREQDPQVRSELARAVGRVGSFESVEAILGLLDDPVLEVAISAAVAIEELGGRVRDNAPVRDQISRRLRGTLERRAPAGNRMNLALREAVLSAARPLRDPQMAQVFAQVVSARPRESTRARTLALSGISELGVEMAQVAAEHVADDDPEIRLAALSALARTADKFLYTEALRDRLRDSDDRVAAEAWRVFEVLLPLGSTEQLAGWAERMRGQRNRERIILLRLVELLEAEGKFQEAASRRQQIGQTYIAENDPAAAIEFFDQALRYAIESDRGGAVLLGRGEALVGALLSAGQYDRLSVVAGELMAINAQEFGTSVGGKIAAEAERLAALPAGEPGDESRRREWLSRLDAAERLIAAARVVNPPLPSRFLDRLSVTEREIARQRARLAP